MTKTPCYITTSHGQIRLWQVGSGPCVVAIAGLSTGASVLADQLASICPGRQILVIEPPGIGGSARAEGRSLDGAAATIAEALRFTGEQPFVLLAWDLCAALLPATIAALQRKPALSIAVGLDRATGWAARGTMPPDLSPRDDGTHLNALWSFIRDRRHLKPDDPTLPSSSGQPLPSDAELSETFIAAVTDPRRFADNWRIYAAGLAAATADDSIRRVGVASEIPALLASLADFEPSGGSTITIAPTSPMPGTRLWHHYVSTRSGRVHVRRAGAEGPPVLVIPTGGASSAQFEPVITGLAATRTAIAFDYLGNGRSDKPSTPATVETLASEAIDLLDALDIGTTDIWGTHTGASVGLEIAIRHPERVGKLVMEAPVIVSPEFLADILANYFPDLRPDKFGLHLQSLWNWRRDMFMYWPWYRADFASTRQIGVPTAEALHQYAVGILESGETYSRAYKAGFLYDTRARLPHLTRPSILCAGPNDMLANALADAAHLAPEGMLEIRPTPTTMWWPDPDPADAAATLAVYRDFLG